mmetsp:Transcript_48567/g.155392  ORF Transcript_48567/g.155392 Transcript_48567/m.155392 type:complete len:246 (-) Transcript_48567:20-757(-)
MPLPRRGRRHCLPQLLPAALSALALLAAAPRAILPAAMAQVVPVPAWTEAGMAMEAHLAFTERLGNCDEDANGAMIHDHSGNGHLAAINKGKLFSGWGFPPMPAVRLTGASGSTSVHLRRLNSRTRSFAVSFWVYITQDLDAYSNINLYRDQTGPYKGLAIETGSKGTRTLRATTEGGSSTNVATCETGPVLRHRVWTHIVFMLEIPHNCNDCQKLFVDGELMASSRGWYQGGDRIVAYLGSDSA